MPSFSRALLTIILIALAQVCFGADTNGVPATLPEALKALDAELANADFYISRRQAQIDSLKRQAPQANSADSVKLLEEIAQAYDGFLVDSCIRYYHKASVLALRHGDRKESQRYAIMQYARMPIQGNIHEAAQGFEAIHHKLYPENAKLFFLQGNRMARFAADLYPESEIRNRFLALADAAIDSLLSYDIHNDMAQIWLSASKTTSHGSEDDEQLVAILVGIVDEKGPAFPYFAPAASRLAEHYQKQGDTERAKYYLAVAALADVRNATLEGVALMRLGDLLHDTGDLNRAYTYLMASLSSSIQSGSRNREYEGSRYIPKIVEAVEHESRRHIFYLNLLAVALVVTVGALVVMLIFRGIRFKKMQRMQEQLKQSNTTKERSISKFIDIITLYADQQEHFMKLARRKIAAGQIENLLDTLKGGSMQREQTAQFIELFDSAFLSVFPDFTAKVNKLLDPDKQIVAEGEWKLNPELRILAFQRLGIMDAPRIARFLGMSVNTVYTYRNRTRSRAASRDTFDDDLMEIGIVSI